MLTQIQPSWLLQEPADGLHTKAILPGSKSAKEPRRQAMSSSKLRARQSRPSSIHLPSRENSDEHTSLSTPSLLSAWSKSSLNDSVPSPLESPDGLYTNFWGPREGSVISSTSSSDSRERLSLQRRRARLERPFIGNPRDSRERCLSVSLVMGADGVAQVQREEVEVEFLENQKDFGLGTASLMKRMVSSAGSDASVSRRFNNLSFVNSTRGEVLVRSASQQTDLSHSIPLTPNMSENMRFVSPEHLKRDSSTMQRSQSSSILRTPQSFEWNDSDASDTDTESPASQQDDAQAAVQRLFDRKRGKVAHGFVGSAMPTSPLARPRISQNTLACSACQIVFRSSAALANHTPLCSVKQTPFASADFFETLDMFGMSSDLMFMADFTEDAQENHIPPLPFESPLDPAFCQDETVSDLTVPSMSPRKKSRFEQRLPSFPSTPTRPRSMSSGSTIRRKR